MRILLAQTIPYVPTLSGASKVGRSILEELAQRNHFCRVVAVNDARRPAYASERHPLDRPLRRSMETRFSSGVETFTLNGVEVHAVSEARRIDLYLMEQVKDFNPTRTLISEDPTYLLLAAALEASPQQTIYLSQSPATLPFGPDSFSPDPLKTQLLGRAAGILAVSNYLKGYIKQWSGFDAITLPLPIYGKGPFPNLASLDNKFVTMINPSAIKGLPIFVGLAHELPDLQFAAVPTWATTQDDRETLERLPNVQLLKPDEDIDKIFAETRILLVPSLWGEAFGIVVVEAMLRGIPVLAGNAGGLAEAKLGIDYLLPVRPIQRYHKDRNDRLLPVPEIPGQEIAPWANALRKLVSDPGHYGELSAASRRRALEYVASLGIAAVEDHLENLRWTRGVPESQKPERIDVESAKHLSLERLELLARRLRQKR